MLWSGYTCFECHAESERGDTAEEVTKKANAAGWAFGHLDGQSHYACENCKELLHDPDVIVHF